MSYNNSDAALEAYRRSRKAANSFENRYSTNKKIDHSANISKNDDRDPKYFKEILENFIKDNGWDVPISIGSVLSRWEEIVGSDIANNAKPEAFENNELIVRCNSTSWAAQIKILLPKILASLASELGDNAIKEIRIIGPYSREWRNKYNYASERYTDRKYV